MVDADSRERITSCGDMDTLETWFDRSIAISEIGELFQAPPRPAICREDLEIAPHVSEWYGHRVFPVVATGDSAADDQAARRCPFLTQAVGTEVECAKNSTYRAKEKEADSRGVCTISASSNGPRQDWVVCPYRALDSSLLAGMVRQLYGLDQDQPVLIRPASALSEAATRDEVLNAARDATSTRAFVYFQDTLSGEIGIPKPLASPQLPIDVTLIELTGQGDDLRVGRYGAIEFQATDTPESYAQAVTALSDALDLHGDAFHAVLQQNLEWAAFKVEGPDISSVFKQTFHQAALKFQVTRRDTSVGRVLALPRPVWDSWQPFLGALDLRQQPDGTWRLLDDIEANPSDWIYVYDISEDQGADGGPASIDVSLVIGTDTATLSRVALDDAPAKVLPTGDTSDAVVNAIIQRLGSYLPYTFVGKVK